MRYIWHAMVVLLWIGGASWAQSGLASPPPTVVPAGTHMLMQLVSPLNTVSATNGSAAYLEVTMPVIVENHIVVPAHTHVTGTVVKGRRPGRVKGRAQLRISFTNLIFPDYRVVPIDGVLQGLPESHRDRRVDAEGTIEPVDQIDRDIKSVAVPALPGTVLGLLGASGPGLRLALLGGGLGLGKTMVTRGDEISLPVGTSVELVLKHDLRLDSETQSSTPAQPFTREQL